MKSFIHQLLHPNAEYVNLRQLFSYKIKQKSADITDQASSTILLLQPSISMLIKVARSVCMYSYDQNKQQSKHVCCNCDCTQLINLAYYIIFVLCTSRVTRWLMVACTVITNTPALHKLGFPPQCYAALQLIGPICMLRRK